MSVNGEAPVVMRPKGKDVTIWVPGELREALAEWEAEHGPLNISAICQPALRAAIERPNAAEALDGRVSEIEARQVDELVAVAKLERQVKAHGTALGKLGRQLDALHRLLSKGADDGSR